MRDERRGRWFEAVTVSGQFLLIKRGVLQAPSPGRRLRAEVLKPRRLSLRVRRAGFRLAVANDLYVHQDDSRPAAAVAMATPAAGAGSA